MLPPPKTVSKIDLLEEEELLSILDEMSDQQAKVENKDAFKEPKTDGQTGACGAVPKRFLLVRSPSHVVDLYSIVPSFFETIEKTHTGSFSRQKWN